jgi:hypothetical protein
MLDRFPDSALVPATLLAAILAMGAMMVPSANKVIAYMTSPAGIEPHSMPAPRAGVAVPSATPVSITEAR